MSIAYPNRNISKEGVANPQHQIWMEQVTDLQIIVGSGSPENVVKAEQGRFYLDTAGIAGSVLYVKRDGDVSGDPKQGWILV